MGPIALDVQTGKLTAVPFLITVVALSSAVADQAGIMLYVFLRNYRSDPLI